MRYFYSFLLYVSVPVLIMRLWWRSLKDKAYRRRIAERFGFYAISLDDCIWIHAVSVGEVIAATPIIQHLRTHYAQKLLVTTMTPTGSQRVQEIFGDQVQHVYLPYDLPDAVQRFIHKMQPKIALIIETELWPNLLAACARRQIPVCLLNARLSARSLRGYQRIAALSREMMQHLCLITAVSAADAKRFQMLGAVTENIKVTGNIKFDMQPPVQHASSPLRKRLKGDERGFIWIAASTHEGEEALLIKAHRLVRAQNNRALLILVPRHRDRFESVASLCSGLLPTMRHSVFAASANDSRTLQDDVAIYLGDSMGELLAFYAAADVAYVGGSLVPHGGHNMIEPAALSKPIVTGPHIFNFAGESELFSAANALMIVQDANALAQQMIMLMQNDEELLAYGKRARTVVSENSGALQRQMNYVAPWLLHVD